MQKTILVLSLLLFVAALYGQENPAPEVKALAVFVRYEGGSKIHYSKYKIIKDFSNTIGADTINVEYYFYKMNDENADTVLLTVSKRYGSTRNYICPAYDARLGIQRAKVDYISSEHWENCETGKGVCKPLYFQRDTNVAHWFLMLPCGGTQTSITITKEGNPAFKQTMNIMHSDCPPCIDLTGWEDGTYFANMLADGLGGRVEFRTGRTW